MAVQQTPPADRNRPSYRVLVKANEAVTKGFVWEIVSNAEDRPAVRRSSAVYRTMEEAYTNGSDALKRLRSVP
jgi:hypothetical protein